MSRCNIPYTCPKIDDVISQCESLSEAVHEMFTRDFEDLGYSIKKLSESYDRFSPVHVLEEIRKANESLREWGEEEADRADELEKELIELREENALLKSDIENMS